MTAVSLDVHALRAQFPALNSGVAHFDGPGGTQTPVPVGRAIADAITAPLSNRGTSTTSERNADGLVRAFRAAYADLLNASPDGIVYGRSATQLTYDFSRHLAKRWQPGDNIVVSRLDHDANVRPWLQAAAARGIEVRWLELDPTTAELRLDTLDRIVDERTRLVAVTAASNLLGTRPDITRIAEQGHRAGALVYVDGVHFTAHQLPDLAALGADFFVCSPYKFFGPHCAVLAADPALLASIEPDKLLPSTDAVPERFEFGTLPYEIMAGATAAVDFLADLPGVEPGTGSRRQRLIHTHEAIAGHERALRDRLDAALRDLGAAVTVYSRAADRTPTTLLTLDGRRSDEVSQFLVQRDILAPAGSFYAWEPFQALGVADDGGVRVGLAAYTTAEEIDRLVSALAELATASGRR